MITGGFGPLLLKKFMTIETPTIEKKQTVTRKFKEPKKYKVVVMNDDFTPMEFVVAMFISIFRKTEADAVSLTLNIHKDGSAIAGVFPHEIAEQKTSDATSMARANGHPLVIKAEQE
jgi:ATP-dependent Clp protease adaptor protein ClpS